MSDLPIVQCQTHVFSTSTPNGIDGTLTANQRCESAAIREALRHLRLTGEHQDGLDNVPKSLIDFLLSDPGSDSELCLGGNHQLGIRELIGDNPNITKEYLHEKMRGVPQRPFHCELARRLKAIREHNNQKKRNGDCGTDLTGDPAFLPAAHFGMSEFCCMNSLIPDPPQQITSVEECTEWLLKSGRSGIFAILGLRHTIGTITKCFDDVTNSSSTNRSSEKQYLLPPSILQLIQSSRKLHKPNSYSNLTVAARALAKHSHRGDDGFFGIVKGSEGEKNRHADVVVLRLIREAEWINIHCFGGVDESRPVMEVRTVDGYGARWSAVWRKDAFSPEEVEFRGFLEPQMDDGHEKRWRH